ncbi:MAG: phenylalanine--tRNA ligase subunit beta [Deltaproteobacteria bacterium]|nr:phenylalanine--tRNA ligase subunit beta [Deltaproteobacteria bacterium]
MKVSLSWLKEYVDVNIDPPRLAEALTMAGLEVDALGDRYAYLDGVVVGHIVKIAPHPKADRLSLCQVDIGSAAKAVVCGAPNIREGHLVPVALPGVLLPSGEKVQAGRIRGEVSEAMLCSEAELAIGTDHSGIMVLPDDAVPGRGLAETLKLRDPVMEFDLTPNRADCLSIIGIAREVAAVLKVPLKYPKVTTPEGRTPIGELARVTIEAPEACPRYAARLISAVRIGPSPFWLQDRLHSVGLRSINNVVDVTNFVMMEMGQPLHAFDFDRLAEHCIVVKTAKPNETFTTLDGMQRILPPDALMICDGKGPVAVAGIMGGLNSEIESDTTRVLIESAYFHPVSIRRTAKALGLNTDSSHRFERGVDPQGTVRALERAVQLMVEVAGGEPTLGLIDENPGPVSPRTIPLNVQRTNRLLGTTFSRDDIAAYLGSIELSVEPRDGDHLDVTAPTFRVDLRRPEDLMEEVARLSGYNNIPTTHPVSRVIARKPDKRLEVRQAIRQVLVGCGFSEIITYSFIGRDACNNLQLSADDPRRNVVQILNPLTEEQGVMRTSLLPGLLTTMFKNSTQRNEDLKIEVLPEEVEMVSGLWTGARSHPSWHGRQTMVDFYDIKGAVEALCAALYIDGVRFRNAQEGQFPYLVPGRTAGVYAGDMLLGGLGEIGKTVAKCFGLKRPAYCFDLNLDLLVELACRDKTMKPQSRFPATDRDVALILDEGVEAQAILDFIHAQQEPLIDRVDIFDVYKGRPLADGEKSLALKFIYQSFERNLTDSEVNTIHEAIVRKIQEHFRARLPERSSDEQTPAR